MISDNALGEFLRARRDQLRPEDVGLAAGSRRRVPGLRREELASLAGISPDYFLRIEQGRVDSPSVQVLDALAKALRLDAASTEHLRTLAGPADSSTIEPTPLRPASPNSSNSWPYLRSSSTGIRIAMASNRLARMLSANFISGRNLLRQMFLDPAERQLHIDWDSAAAGLVGGLRQVAGAAPTDPRFRALVDDLSRRSEAFQKLWARADVGFRPAGDSHMRHPEFGELHLLRQRLDIPDSNGQHLHLYHATPDSESARKLDEMRSALAERRSD